MGLEPTSPRYGRGVLAAGRPVLPGVGPEGLEPSPARLRAGCAAANTLVPSSFLDESAQEESNLRLSVIDRSFSRRTTSRPAGVFALGAGGVEPLVTHL